MNGNMFTPVLQNFHVHHQIFAIVDLIEYLDRYGRQREVAHESPKQLFSDRVRCVVATGFAKRDIHT